MRTLVIIPTYNESENIRALTEAVLRVSPDLELLIVDDNSPDGTGEIADALARENPRVHVLHRPRKMGLGSAYIEGFRYALQNGYEAVVEMDADFSHDPQDIPRLLDALEEADLAIGSRYMNGVSVVNWPIKRLLLSYFANWYARVVTRVPVRDLTAGFKAYRREVLEAIDFGRIVSDGYAFQIEMKYKAWEKGFRLREVPIIFVERRAGTSKMSKRIIREAFVLVLRLGVRTFWRKLRGKSAGKEVQLYGRV